MRGNERMNDLPRLLKPYYSIEETFKRLNLAGANLDKEGDIYLLAAENNISIHVLLLGDATLLKDSSYKPHYLKVEGWLDANIDKETVDFSLNQIGNTKEEVKKMISNINSPALMIPRSLYKGDIADAIDKVELEYVYEGDESVISNGHEPGDLDPVLNLSFKPFPISVKLMKAELDYQRGMYGEPKEYNLVNASLLEDLLSLHEIVDFGDGAYYVCSSTNTTYFDEMVRHKVSFKDGTFFYPSYRLEGGLVNRLIRNKCLAVTKASIQNFEREHLGVNHELDAIEKLPYLDAKNENYAQELDIAIEAHTAIFSNNEGNQNQSRTERVKTWLKNKYPNKSEAFYERITTVVLPKKNK